jgi:hypothetical protein
LSLPDVFLAILQVVVALVVAAVAARLIQLVVVHSVVAEENSKRSHIALQI